MCLTHELWIDLSNQLHNFLESISLKELVDRREVRVVAMRQNQAQRQRQEDTGRIPTN